MKDYVFKTTPYEHQKKIWQESWGKSYYALFLEMGTGKTKIAIDTIGALFMAGEIDTALIIAPKGIYDNWVKKEIPAHLPEDIPYKALRWQNNLSNKYVAELKDLAVNREQRTLNILVMNVEALSAKKKVMSKAAKTAIRFLELNPNCITVVDESTTIKRPKASRTETVLQIARRSKYRRILTGSPITKDPMDLYSQCQFLDPKALGYSSYYAFQGRYSIVRRRKMGTREFQEIVGYRRLDELNQKLEEFSSRVLKEDCLDLPDKIYTEREVALTPEQQQLYKQMKANAMAMLESGELSTTATILTQIMRLHQIVCGFIKDNEGKIHPIKNNKMNELLNICDEVQGKAIIWATWSHDIEAIKKALSEQYGEESVACYFGETHQDERQAIVEKFQDTESKLRFFVGQPKTGGYGLTLTAANTMIYFSNSYDLEIRLQSEDRAHRIGQTKSVTYVDLVSPKTIDEVILKALRNKINLAGMVLGEEVKEWLR